MSDDRRIEPWRTIGTEPGPDLRIFSTRLDEVENPRNGHRMRAFVLETADWVNVVARTAEGRFVLVEQHRFGTGRVSLEVPGGIVDPGEAPLDTARRELLEETGYTATDWRRVGTVDANPAFMDNQCHFFLAADAQASGAQALDDGEDIVVLELDVEELAGAIAGGRVRNSLTLLALSRAVDLSGVRFPDPA